MRSGAEFFARLWRANFYRFTQGLHGRALLPFYAKSSSLLPSPHPICLDIADPVGESAMAELRHAIGINRRRTRAADYTVRV